MIDSGDSVPVTDHIVILETDSDPERCLCGRRVLAQSSFKVCTNGSTAERLVRSLNIDREPCQLLPTSDLPHPRELYALRDFLTTLSYMYMY